MTSNYWASTQYNDWLLSRSQIAFARAEDLEYANSADELFALRIWLINCISLLTKRLTMRQRITATAIVFFNRFYTCSPGNSLSSTDPALVATACVYVAAKVEETPVHIRNVVQEASKIWAELGHFNMSNDVATLAEMEFYLLEDLQFHLVVYHPYRSLITIASAVGNGSMQNSSHKTTLETWAKIIGASTSSSNTSTPKQQDQSSTLSGYLLGSELNTATFMDTDLAFGNPADGLSGKMEDSTQKSAQNLNSKEHEQKRAMEEAMEERHRLLLFSGDDDMPLAHLEELDEQVLQMAWFVLNDAYRTDVLLLFPPHLVAVASIFFALVLHDSSREKMLKSKKWMDERRETLVKAMNSADAEVAAKSPAGDVVAEQKIESRVNSPSAALSPPKQQQQPSQSSANGSTANKLPLRGLASLPPRPSHLPPRPTVGTPNQPSNPPTPIGTPKPAETSMRGSPIPNGNAIKSTNEDQAKSKVSSINSMPVPPPDAMTFLAALNVDLNSVGEIVQEMIGLYQFWSREGQGEGVIDFNDGAGMLKILTRMRESRRIDLLQNGPGW